MKINTNIKEITFPINSKNNALTNKTAKALSKNKTNKSANKVDEIVKQKEEMEKTLQKMKENRNKYITQLKTNIENAAKQYEDLVNKIAEADDEFEALKEKDKLSKLSEEEIKDYLSKKEEDTSKEKGNGFLLKDVLSSLDEINEYLINAKMELENYTKNSAKEIEEMQKKIREFNNNVKKDNNYITHIGNFINKLG